MRKILVKEGFRDDREYYSLSNRNTWADSSRISNIHIRPSVRVALRHTSYQNWGTLCAPPPNPGLRAMTGHRVRSYTLQNMSFMIKVDQRHGGHLILCPHPSKM